MSDQPTVGLALIARDEEKTLLTLLASIEGAFDQVVLVDTGSKDQTVQLFKDWCISEAEFHPYFRHAAADFIWCDDFAAPRAFADSLLSTDWKVWADCDDEIRGALNLRPLAAQAPPEIAAFVADYDYAQVEGRCVCRLRRERLVRAGAGEWQGRVHEAQAITGNVTLIGPEVVEWVHRKPADQPVGDRNLRILRSWLKDEPENPRVLGYLGTEYLARGQHKRALTYFRRYLKLKTGWDEERAQIHRKLSVSLMALGRHREAMDSAFEALALMPQWPDSYLTLAEASYYLGEPQKAIEWAEHVARRGVPETLLIINPTDYVAQPRVVIASAYGALGDVERAVEVAEEALQAGARNETFLAGYSSWRSARKREHTASSVLALAQVLMGHDEQLKALQVLDSAPYYCTDHPQVVALRSMLRERLNPLFDERGYADHYETGGSKPEDFIPDDRVLAIGDALPRCGFMLEGLREQAELAA